MRDAWNRMLERQRKLREAREIGKKRYQAAWKKGELKPRRLSVETEEPMDFASGITGSIAVE